MCVAVVVALLGAPTAGAVMASMARAGRPGQPLSRSNPTPFPVSRSIVGARWTSLRYDPPRNQWGDILPTVWSDDGSTYVMMDDGGVDAPGKGSELWRQSLAKIHGAPPRLRFTHVGDPFSPPPHTWSQIGGNRQLDTGPLGPYYSIGFVEDGGVFYATQQRDWNWAANGPFTGLAGIAYSSDHGETWNFADKPFPAPLGNLTFIDGGAPGGGHDDGYVYAIGTEREFNASRLLLGRVPEGIQSITDPSRWQWFAGFGARGAGRRAAKWTSAVSAAVPVLSWGGHVTYPQMTFDRALGHYLLTFTYSYSSSPPALWRGGAELVILESASANGPFSFVARSPDFGPSNGYDAGFPSQWISRDGRDLWLKWAANFAGCWHVLDCSGKYGFNVARLHLTTASISRPAPRRHARARARARRSVIVLHARDAAVASATSVPLLAGLWLLGRLRARGRRARR